MNTGRLKYVEKSESIQVSIQKEININNYSEEDTEDSLTGIQVASPLLEEKLEEDDLKPPCLLEDDIAATEEEFGKSQIDCTMTHEDADQKTWEIMTKKFTYRSSSILSKMNGLA